MVSVVSATYHVEGEALYWKANEGGLAYALKTSDGNLGGGSLKEPEFEWDFGFKLAIGRLFPQDWTFLLRLTQLQTHTDASHKATGEKTLYPIWITQGPASSFANRIKMHWRLHFSFLDALVEKRLEPLTHFIIRPQLGLRYALVRQKYNLDYEGGEFSGREEAVRMKNKFWGIGPYGALGLEWPFWRQFSLCAQGGFAAAYGQFYLHEDEVLLAEDRKILGLRDSFYRIVPIADIGLSLRWQKVWDKSQRKLILLAGWDATFLFNQNRLFRFFESSPVDHPSNLQLKGWEWGAQYIF